MVYRIITTNAHNPLASIHKNLLDSKQIGTMRKPKNKTTLLLLHSMLFDNLDDISKTTHKRQRQSWNIKFNMEGIQVNTKSTSSPQKTEEEKNPIQKLLKKYQNKNTKRKIENCKNSRNKGWVQGTNQHKPSRGFQAEKGFSSGAWACSAPH